MTDLNKMMQNTARGRSSSWAGLDPAFSIEHQETGINQYLAVLKKGEEEAGFMGYAIRPGGVLEQGPMMIFEGFRGQGHGSGLISEIMKKGKSKGAITFRSDPAGLSPEMISTFEAGERRGIFQSFAGKGQSAFKANLLKLDVAKMMAESSHLAPGRSKSLITGLAEGGVASRLRKLLTLFGSGWQGLGEEAIAKDSFERTVGRNFSMGQQVLDKIWSDIRPHVTAEKVTLLGGGVENAVFDLGEKVVKIGFGEQPFHPNIPEILQPHFQGKIEPFENAEELSYRTYGYSVMPKIDTTPVAPSEITAMSERLKSKGFAADEAVGNWGTHEGRTVLMDVGGLAKINESIMKTGEGMAISRAGTAEVPAVLKATSRIMKSLV